MLRDILGALEFITFLGGLAWLCGKLERLPVHSWLCTKLHMEVSGK